MDEVCTVITPRAVTAALDSLDELDRRLTQAEADDGIKGLQAALFSRRFRRGYRESVAL